MAVSGNSFFALDFGTSNTVALYYKDGQLMNVVDSNNLPYIPSMLSGARRQCKTGAAAS